mgnify:CR=1 FL=1
MNIDYGQILKNATARQEALELLELNLRELDAISNHLAAAHVRLKDIWGAYRAIDTEGRSLLNGDLDGLLAFVGTHIECIDEATKFVEDLIDHIDANKDS